MSLTVNPLLGSQLRSWRVAIVVPETLSQSIDYQEEANVISKHRLSRRECHLKASTSRTPEVSHLCFPTRNFRKLMISQVAVDKAFRHEHCSAPDRIKKSTQGGSERSQRRDLPWYVCSRSGAWRRRSCPARPRRQ